MSQPLFLQSQFPRASDVRGNHIFCETFMGKTASLAFGWCWCNMQHHIMTKQNLIQCEANMVLNLCQFIPVMGAVIHVSNITTCNLSEWWILEAKIMQCNYCCNEALETLIYVSFQSLFWIVFRRNLCWQDFSIDIRRRYSHGRLGRPERRIDWPAKKEVNFDTLFVQRGFGAGKSAPRGQSTAR